MNKKNDTNLNNAITDIAKNLEGVFKKYSKNTRIKAWEKITSKEGEKQVKKILNDPNIPINTFQKLATQKENSNFKDWLVLEEKSSRTKKGKKVPSKYLSGLSEKGKKGSKEAMKKEIDRFRGKDEYKSNWDADYKNGKRIKTKKGKATKAFERRFGR